MLVAITSNDGSITRCFEEVRRFEIYEATETDKTLLPNIYIEESDDAVAALASAGVELLICGSIDHIGEYEVRKAGIHIIRDTLGDTADILLAWQSGYLEPSDSPMCENVRFGSR